VVLRKDAGDAQRLVAYYVEADTPRSPEGLRAALADDLPDYMIPSAWIRLDALPLSPNGKLDRAALPVPDSLQAAQDQYVAPTTPTEIALTKIFGEVLHLDQVSVAADLLKMGADSIQLFQITARANRAGIKVSAKQLLQLRTAAAVAALADAGDAEAPAAGDTKLPTLGQFQRARRAGAGISARR
jgi:aryl carrier-like protein